MTNDDKLTPESKNLIVDMLLNREGAQEDTKVNCNYECFIDNIMKNQQSQNTKFAVRLRNVENSFHPKVFNAYSKIDLEAIKQEMGISEGSGGIFEIGRFENEKLVARLCIDMRGQPIHWEVLQSEV